MTTKRRRNNDSPATPAPRSSTSHPTASPPASPSSATMYDASSEDEVEVDDLGESFHIVSSPRNGQDDDGSSTTSTINTSLRDSVIGTLSDTSSERPGGSVSGGSIAGELEEIDIEMESDTDGSASLIGGSYADAEATESNSTSNPNSMSISDLADSRNTISQYNEGDTPAANSLIRLVFPTPEASFTSSGTGETISGGDTPSGSLANLLPPVAGDKDRDAKSRDTAERFDRLAKSVQKMEEMMHEHEREREQEHEQGEYQLLASTDGIDRKDSKASSMSTMQATSTDSVSGAKPHTREARRKTTKQSDDARGETKVQVRESHRRRQLREALANAAAIELGGGAKKWGVLAIASFVSLALLGTFGPGISLPLFGFRNAKSPINQPVQPPSDIGRTLSVLDLLSASTSAATTSESSSATSLSTHYIPDLQKIRHALSTLSTAPNKVAIPDAVTTGGATEPSNEPTVGRRKRKEAMASTASFPVSVRDANVALTVASVQAAMDGYKVWTQAIKQKILDTAKEIKDVKEVNESKESKESNVPVGTKAPNASSAWPSADASTGISQQVRDQLGPRLSTAFGLARNYSIAASKIVGPLSLEVLQALDKELHGLLSLAQQVLQTTAVASGPVLRRAARNLAVLQHTANTALRQLYDRLRDSTPSDVDREAMAREAIARARAGLDALAEYVEGQASNVQEKSRDSLRQARKGLDKLVDRFSKEQDEVKPVPDVHEDGPMPFARMRPGRTGREGKRQRTTGSHRHCHGVAAESACGNFVAKSKERIARKVSRGARLLEHIHHAAIQLVL
ncbi:hypothetical protein EHS25_008055 [Saitozyma podzolica]|uniref:Uncharacterized protein n=1 Tax=Saitozyma podzolica TaxID=1890683 RepID=A0A427YNI4_9TREE|nr:hypothetical protein EHS25_008055 [Saitozyma podzolica]